ncbi:MAG: galactose mutarotase [Desulfofustis sp.]|nr:galactose mutarotase [Desulfofustis sp.]NNK58391.1 galactose mutarotase [Desulfofustis sp.]
MAIVSEEFGRFKDRTIHLYTMSNTAGVKVSVTNYGGIMTSVKVPDRDGQIADVVLGYDTLQEYTEDSIYIGSVVGRYANRIKGGMLKLGQSTYQLSCNRPGIHLHGGNQGFNKKIWEPQVIQNEGAPGLRLFLDSPDGDEGYPGNLRTRVSYALTEDSSLIIEYEAETDKPTVVNLTQHSYFNLAGQGDITNHLIQINGSEYTPVGPDLIPTGELAEVQGSPFDFRRLRRISEAMAEEDKRKKAGDGFDHNYVLDTRGDIKKIAAYLYHEKSGRIMAVYTTKPGMQFYSGNYLDGRWKGRGGVGFFKHAALCLETQYYPDSPNHPLFPSPLLLPGDIYRHTTIYRFGLRSK